MISIDTTKGKISYQTFQKPRNPFLYIPGHSSHPPMIVKSLIHGLKQTYHRQNKEQEQTFDKNISQLFQQLIVQGHLYYVDIHPIFIKKHGQIDNKHNSHNANTNNNNTTIQTQLHNTRKNNRNDIFFHLPYHPMDISQRQRHHIYQHTCNAMDNSMGGTMQITKLAIAYTRGQNLYKVLCSSSLKENNTCKVSNCLTL